MNIFLTGVGGHGVLAVSRVIAETALAAGLDVRKSEVHGMSQRGGSVVSQVRYGERVYSSLMARGSADVLLSLELLEAARHLDWLRRDGVLLANLQRITPAPVGGLLVDYPADPRALCEERVERALFLPALAVARDLGEERAANMVMLGAFSVLSEGIPADLWEDVVGAAFRPAFRETNLLAFRAGRDLVPASFAAEVRA